MSSVNTNLWDSVLAAISKEVDVKYVDRWLRPIKLVEASCDKITLSAPNHFVKVFVEQNYLVKIKQILKKFAVDAELIFIEDKSAGEKTFEQTSPVKSLKGNVSGKLPASNTWVGSLYNAFTFDNFVSGDSNMAAYRAAETVSAGNLSVYNPLFIYGDTGLGKTHLMHAVSNKLQERFPKMRVLYVEANEFVREVSNAMRVEKGQVQDNVDKLREKYRSADLLLFDDIQFLKDKAKSLEMFFYVFNDLQLGERQIIITSDESPHAINMDKRMRSRFASGFQAEIMSPSADERVAILAQKADELGLKINNDLLVFLADNLAATNGRELIGALKQLELHASFEGETLSIEFAERVLAKNLKQTGIIVSPEKMIMAVSDAFSVKVQDLSSDKRTQAIVVPRGVAMYLMRVRLGMSLKEVGAHFGGRDHTTVMHSVEKITKRLETDDVLKNVIANIEKRVHSNA
ncbi:chromosomal replication initiator protein DnaA [Deferribacterales bacterium RsTz2092]|nr:chromosomal replication initiator protein DnaA [Deferribacterales bacterium]